MNYIFTCKILMIFISLSIYACSNDGDQNIFDPCGELCPEHNCEIIGATGACILELNLECPTLNECMNDEDCHSNTNYAGKKSCAFSTICNNQNICSFICTKDSDCNAGQKCIKKMETVYDLEAGYCGI